MELVLSILGNFWYMLGSSSPQKRQIPQKNQKTAEGSKKQQKASESLIFAKEKAAAAPVKTK